MMSFGSAIQAAFKNTFNFSGRALRSEYWWFSLFQALIVIPLVVIAVAAAVSESMPLIVIAVLAAVAFVIVFFIPSLSIVVRRLHDIDRSGWWYLGYYLASVAISIVDAINTVDFTTPRSGALDLVTTLLSLGLVIWFIVWMAWPSTSGPNRFGEPRNPNVIDARAPQGFAGYPPPGYPQQGGYGYPPPGGYPGQPGYTDQSGYPPPGGYPNQPGYPDQSGYPQPGSYPNQAGHSAQDGHPNQPGFANQGYGQPPHQAEGSPGSGASQPPSASGVEMLNDEPGRPQDRR